MLFNLNSKGCDVQEFLSKEGTYIGILSKDNKNSITPSDISLDKIEEHLNDNDEFLVCCGLTGYWWSAVLFNTPDGANKVKTNFKGKPMLWYWLKRSKFHRCFNNSEINLINKLYPINPTKHKI